MPLGSDVNLVAAKPKISIALALTAAVFTSCVSMTERNAHLAATATQALHACDISPSEIEWRITDEGVFAFSPKSAPSYPFTDLHAQCLANWAQQNGIKLAVLGLEQPGE